MRRSDQRGVTLLEAMCGLAILGILAVAIGSISLSGFTTTTTRSVTRNEDAVSVQFAARSFARDVQGARGVATVECTIAGADGLVTLVASDDESLIGYGTVADASGHRLVRSECGSTGAITDSSTVADELPTTPTVDCDGVACVAGADPAEITLHVNRAEGYTVPLTGSRRATSAGSVADARPAELFSLGGISPLQVQGNGTLRVIGNAFVNSSSATAVSMAGNNSRLSVTGDFHILAGGGCSGCNATKTSPYPPGSYPAALPDPLAYLPAPTESDLGTGSCSAGACRPGVFTSAVSITGSATFAPGTYVFRRGLSISGNGTISGTGVVLYNGCGSGAPSSCTSTQGAFSVSGQAAVNLTAPTTGVYEGILYFQSRTNASTVSISGGSKVMSYGGVLYAPSATEVALGAGSGGLTLSSVVGKGLRVTGNGTVTVNGA